MRKTKKIIAAVLAVVMVLLMVPTGAIPVKAASASNLTFSLNEDGESYSVMDCSESASGKMEIPATYNGKPVTGIGNDAFYFCESLTSIAIPDSVTSIGWYAFSNCYSLTSITIPNSVTSIGSSAFNWCENLTRISIPNGVTSIGNGVFRDCHSLTSVTIPNSVTSICWQAFAYCYSLTSITIPESVTSIGNQAFYECENLTNITIPESVTSIGNEVFAGCYSLTSVTIPDGVTSIGNGVFRCCDSLTSITIPDSISSIGDSAFHWCTSLLDIYYSGSEQQFSEIKIGINNEVLNSATIQYNYMDENQTLGSWKREDGFNFYLNHPSNYINVNSTVDLHIGYYLNNVLDSSVNNYIYTVSNSDVIGITDNGWSAKYGQKLKVTAKQTGSSTITVTNPNTSESSSLEIYVTGNESGWNFYNIPKMTIEAGKTTNFYNFNGLVVDDFSYSEHQNADGNTDYYIVSMNVYNSNNLYGAVTSYDRYGEIYEYVLLDKIDTHDSSFVNSCKSLYYSFGDCYYLIQNSKFYSGKSIAKETPVTLKVPAGGHLSMSNNSKYSDVVCAANTIGLIFDATMLTYDFATMNVDEDLLVDKKVVIKEVLQELAEKQSLKLLKEKVWDFLGSGSSMNSFSFSTTLELNAILKREIEFDIKNAVSTVVDNSLSVAETVVKKALPTGGIIDLMYTFSDGCNLATFLHMYLLSFDCSTAINIYAPSDSSKYQSNGISIDTQENMSETVVHAYTVTDTGSAGINKNTFSDESTYYSKKYQTYNITLYKNGSETQPSSTVTVRIPIPNGFNKLNRSALKVYRNNDDGTLTNMNAHVEGDYIVFETDHFSYYSIVDESVPSIAEDLKFSGASLTLQDDLTINYKVNKSVFDASGYTNPYVEFVMNDNKTVTTKYEVIDDKYVFRFTNIAPDLLNDSIYATLYAEKEDMTYYSISREYSIAEYCYSMLDLYAADEYTELRTLIVNLLHYGAASQTYTGYKTDALVNASLTTEQLQWGTSEEPTLDTVLDTIYKTIENPTAKWKGAGLNLQESISIRLKFTAESVEDLRVVVESGTSKWTIFSDDFYEEDGVYYVYFTGLDAGQMRQSVYLTIYDGDTPVSNTACYSIGSYAYEKQNSTIAGLPELVKAMMKYGDSAYGYVH